MAKSNDKTHQTIVKYGYSSQNCVTISNKQTFTKASFYQIKKKTHWRDV